MIFSKVLDSGCGKVEMDKVLRAQRLSLFRDMGLVCKAWLDPARTVFWSKVTLFALPEFIAFARAVNSSSGKPECIRQLYLQIAGDATNDDSTPAFAEVAQEVKRYFPDALRRLPAHLDELHINCQGNDVLLHDVLQATHSDPSWVIDVNKLTIGARIDKRDIFPVFAFARNVHHLALVLDTSDTSDTFSSPCSFKQLRSLVIQLEFDGDEDCDVLPDVTNSVMRTLKPACEALQSLTLDLLRLDDVNPTTRVEAVKPLLHLTGSSTSFLSLLATPTRDPINFIAELSRADALLSCPTLRRLDLRDVGASVEAFSQLGCSDLQQLEIIVKAVGVSVMVGEAFANLIQVSLEQPELSKLEKLKVYVKTMFIPMFLIPGTGKPWNNLRNFCASRNIDYNVKNDLSAFGS
jgi:hypothetical protein